MVSLCGRGFDSRQLHINKSLRHTMAKGFVFLFRTIQNNRLKRNYIVFCDYPMSFNLPFSIFNLQFSFFLSRPPVVFHKLLSVNWL